MNRTWNDIKTLNALPERIYSTLLKWGDPDPYDLHATENNLLSVSLGLQEMNRGQNGSHFQGIILFAFSKEIQVDDVHDMFEESPISTHSPTLILDDEDLGLLSVENDFYYAETQECMAAYVAKVEVALGINSSEVKTEQLLQGHDLAYITGGFRVDGENIKEFLWNDQ